MKKGFGTPDFCYEISYSQSHMFTLELIIPHYFMLHSFVLNFGIQNIKNPLFSVIWIEIIHLEARTGVKLDDQ